MDRTPVSTIDRSPDDLQPVVWLDCPVCGRGLKSTWFIREPDTTCDVCGTELEFVIVSGLDATCHPDADWVADGRVLRTGDGFWFPCGCGDDLQLSWLLTDRKFSCNRCGRHHHVEVVWNRTDWDPTDADTLEKCGRCGELSPRGLFDWHHIQYDDPEIIMRICRSCHSEISTTDGRLHPDEIPDGVEVRDLPTE